MSKTFYDYLGVAISAEPEVIRVAYKALAHKYHPDRNPNNPEAEQMMKLLNEAYETLSDPVKRKRYDEKIKGAGDSASKSTHREYNSGFTQNQINKQTGSSTKSSSDKQEQAKKKDVVKKSRLKNFF